jgi:hypothetical protein
MDVYKTLQELYEERRRLDLAIASLEARQRTLARMESTPRRWRKTMSEEERRAVSIRMAKYWEARKAARVAIEPTPSADDAEAEAANATDTNV